MHLVDRYRAVWNIDGGPDVEGAWHDNEPEAVAEMGAALDAEAAGTTLAGRIERQFIDNVTDATA